MPLPVITDTWRVALNYSDAVGSNRAENVIHLRGDGTVGSAIDSNIQAAMTAAGTNLLNVVSSEFVLDSLDATFLGTATGASHHHAFTGVLNGQSGGGPMYPVSAVITLRTALRGRSYRGRIYLPPAGESSHDAGRMSATAVANLSAAWAQFADTLAAATNPTPLVVASYLHRTSEIVTAVQANRTYGVQRRRQRRLAGRA